MFGVLPVDGDILFDGCFQIPADVRTTPVQYIDKEEALQYLCKHLKKENAIAVDLEVYDDRKLSIKILHVCCCAYLHIYLGMSVCKVGRHTHTSLVNGTERHLSDRRRIETCSR